jgi:hypothetical protein
MISFTKRENKIWWLMLVQGNMNNKGPSFPLVDWWYNISYHMTTHMTPFEQIYGQNPQLVLPYMPSISKIHKVDRNLTTHMTILHTLKDNLVMAQNHME